MQGFGDIAEKLRRSTVYLRVGRRGQGSGIIVSPDGMIVTNAHVATLGRADVQFWDGVRSEADLLLRDAGRDLAILQVSRSGLYAAVLADSDRLRVGELVIAVGNPFGFTGALTSGVIHAIGPVPKLQVGTGSAAARASLMCGDVLVGVERSDLETIEDVERAPGGNDERAVRLQFLRGDPRNIRTVTVRLGLPSMAAV